MGRENSWQKQEEKAAGVVVLWNARIYSIFCESKSFFSVKMNSWFITDYSDPLWIYADKNEWKIQKIVK